MQTSGDVVGKRETQSAVKHTTQITKKPSSKKKQKKQQQRIRQSNRKIEGSTTGESLAAHS